MQERQMTSVAEREANVHVIGVQGTSDDLDVPIEACFRDAAFKSRHHLGSVNSVNIVRLLVQTVHFFYAYLRVEPAAARALPFAVPCGAGGHMAAGVLAIEMGLPARILAATNANDALHRALSTESVESLCAKGRSMEANLSFNTTVRFLDGVRRRVDHLRPNLCQALASQQPHCVC